MLVEFGLELFGSVYSRFCLTESSPKTKLLVTGQGIESAEREDTTVNGLSVFSIVSYSGWITLPE